MIWTSGAGQSMGIFVANGGFPDRKSFRKVLDESKVSENTM